MREREKSPQYIEIPRLGAVIETTRARTVSAKSAQICSGIYGYIEPGDKGVRGQGGEGRCASAHLVRIGLQ